MKKNIANIFSLFIVITLLTACSKDERLLFDEETQVYFNTTDFGVTDSTNYSFALLGPTVTRDTFYLNVRITGFPVDYDRKINIVTDASSTAIAGYHYQITNPIIPAGAYDNDLEVVVFRRDGLKDSLVTTMLNIEDSEDLRAGYDDLGSWPVSRVKYSRRQYKLSITDKLVKPSNWDSTWLPSFGTYSNVKIRYITEVTGFTNWTGSVYPQDKDFVVQKARYELYKYEQENGDLLDENGEPVKFN